MELQTIVERYAEAIERIDVEATEGAYNARTGEVYRPGFKSMNEDPAWRLVDYTWSTLRPGELQVHATGHRYPDLPATAKADHVFTTDGGGSLEWAIEVKRLQTAGDNGKPNDFAVTKVLSPYLKDRGMLHDMARLRAYPFSRRIAIVGYGFDYDSQTVAEGLRRFHSAGDREVLANISKSVTQHGPLRLQPLIEFADAIIRLRGFTSGPSAQAPFTAWRHPAGGHGTVFGWEIRRPDLHPDYDPRHPW